MEPYNQKEAAKISVDISGGKGKDKVRSLLKKASHNQRTLFRSLGHELAESLGNRGGGLLAGRLASGVGKDDPNKLRELNEKYLRIYGAVLGRAPKGKRIMREEWRGLIERR